MWTNEQQNAIDAPIGDIIVTAAAGSGKTAVMVERIIGRLTGENPVDADKILVVTFTNAAAATLEKSAATLHSCSADSTMNPSTKVLRRYSVM